ncbi:MAG: response regulator [Gammaproteobacteria bacterium]|nr:MAG: response regulator [Gammaproteobacteria bacterium]
MAQDSHHNKTPLRILVVDDNIDAAETLSMLLELNGHNAHTAHDGLEAIKLAVAFKPQVIFLDIAMPDMNGYETAEAIRKTYGLENVIIVALTGWDAESERIRSGETRFNYLLTKPVQIDQINSLLATLNFSQQRETI